MRVIIRSEAEADLARAYVWYEQQRFGLGEEFLEEVSMCLQRIEYQPLSFPIAREPSRRAIVRRFPYALFFVFRADEISVLAAFHMARHPRVLSMRLGPDT